jgi:hypothetical protein
MRNQGKNQILERKILEIIHFQEAFRLIKITVIPQKDPSILPEIIEKPRIMRISRPSNIM